MVFLIYIFEKSNIFTCYLSISATSDLLQPIGSVLNQLQRVSLQLGQFGYSVAELLAQQRILLPELLHRNPDLGQRATAAFALFTQSLRDNQGKEECTDEASSYFC